MTVQPPSPPYVGPARHTMGSNNKPIARIVMHATVGSEPAVKGAARGVAAMFRTTDRYASAHYVADAAESVQVVYDSLVAEHAPPNQHSIGYELCCSLANEGKDHWARTDHQAMLKIAAQDVARLCLAYDVPIVKLSPADLVNGKHGICGHIDVSNAWHQTTHWDPGPYFPWAQFIGLVHAAAKALTDKPNPQPPRPADADFFVAEISGRWDAPDDPWKQAIANAVHARAEVIMFTETTIDGRMRRVCPDRWDFGRLDDKPGESECSIMWKKAARTRASKPYATRLAETQFYTEKGHLRPPVTSITEALADNDGNVDLFTALHMPSGDSANRLKAHVEVTDAIPEAWDKGRELHPDAGRVLGVDTNRDWRRADVRQAWAETFPMLEMCWNTVPLPDRGTHGAAILDGVAAGTGRLTIASARVLPHVPGLDHTGIIVGLART
jgi:hypothetical protein